MWAATGEQSKFGARQLPSAESNSQRGTQLKAFSSQYSQRLWEWIRWSWRRRRAGVPQHPLHVLSAWILKAWIPCLLWHCCSVWGVLSAIPLLSTLRTQCILWPPLIPTNHLQQLPKAGRWRGSAEAQPQKSEPAFQLWKADNRHESRRHLCSVSLGTRARRECFLRRQHIAFGQIDQCNIFRATMLNEFSFYQCPSSSFRPNILSWKVSNMQRSQNNFTVSTYHPNSTLDVSL